jgi:hypothetical protein
MSSLHFRLNSLSDPTFEAYLKDTHRYRDYCEVRDQVLPRLITSIDQLPQQVGYRFSCSNRFEGPYPALRIHCPVGFVPDEIWIGFPQSHDSFFVKQTAQEFKVKGLENLENHLRVILMMGLAHWRPR